MAQINEDKEQESAIDKARNRENIQKKEINWAGLGKDILSFLLKLIIIFLIGSRIVFACKVAQANILPTDLECMPYTPATTDEETPKYQTNTPEANIDVTHIYNTGTESYEAFATIIAFEINKYTRQNYLLDRIRKIEYDPNVGSMVKYLCVVIKNIFVFYYGITSSLFNFMNSYLNESFILLLGPYLLMYMSILLYPISVVLCIIFCITNFGWLMMTNKNNDADYKHKSLTEPVWRSCNPLSSMYNFLGTIIYLYIGFLFATTLSISPIPALIGLICILTPLFMKAKIIDPTNPDKPLKDDATYGFSSSIIGLIESKLDVFMFIFCIYTTYATYKNSTNTMAPVLVALASIWFLYRTMKYKQPPRLASENLVSYDRNEKFCPEKKLTKEDLDKLERDNQDDDERDKEAYEDSFIGQIIKFWTTLPKTIYDALFGPDKPCPVGGNMSPDSAAAADESTTPSPEVPAPELPSMQMPEVPSPELPSPEIPSLPKMPKLEVPNKPSSEIEMTPLRGQRGGHLLRKMKKLTDTLKRRGSK